MSDTDPFGDPLGEPTVSNGILEHNGVKYFPEHAIKALRAEAASRRLELKARPTVEEVHTLKVQLALTRAAYKHNADIELLAPFVADRINDLDPTDSTAVDALVTEALVQKPSLKVGATHTPTAPRSVGMDFTNNGVGNPAPTVPTGVDDALWLSRAGHHDDVLKMLREGRIWPGSRS